MKKRKRARASVLVVAIAVLSAFLCSAHSAQAVAPPVPFAILDVLKFAGEKLGGPAAKAIINRTFPKADATYLKNMLGLEAEDKITPQLLKMDRQLGLIEAKTNQIYTNAIFSDYDKVWHELETFMDRVKSQNSPQSIENACEDALGEHGLDIRMRNMQNALFARRTGTSVPRSKGTDAPVSASSAFALYSDYLVATEGDVYEQRAALEAIYKEYEIRITTALFLDDYARTYVKDKTKIRYDALPDEVLELGRQEYARVIGPAQLLTQQIDDMQGKVKFRIHHHNSGGYLTAWANGTRKADTGPVGSLKGFPLPEVFTFVAAQGQKWPDHGNGGFMKVTTDMQEWFAIKEKDADGRVVVHLQNVKSGQYLAGVERDHVYLTDKPDPWRVVLPKNASITTGRDSPSFLLKHVGSGRAVESDGDRAYADKPLGSEKNQVWEIRTPSTKAAWTDKVDVAVSDQRKAYFFSFKTGEYVRFDMYRDEVDTGFPKKIADDWPGLPVPFDTALSWKDGVVFFFNGSKYQRWNLSSDKPKLEGEKSIKDGWKQVWEDRVDMAFTASNGKTYLFNNRTGEYISWNVREDEFNAKRKISDEWPGVAEKGFNTVFAWASNTPNAWFIRGNQMTRYDMEADKLDAESIPVPSP